MSNSNNGYLYCISNESMPGILKIGMTYDILEMEDTYDNPDLPTPYKMEFAKKVLDPIHKELDLHTLLSQNTERINPNRAFFRISLEDVKKYFNLIDGEIWIPPLEEDTEDEEETEEEAAGKSNCNTKGCRDMAKCFTNGQFISHTIGNNHNQTWIGRYDASRNGIIADTQFYKSISQFATSHYSKCGMTNRKTANANGWKECKYEKDGKWISTYNILE